MSIGVGIDIGAFAVKVAVLRFTGRKTTLEGLAHAEVAGAGGVSEAIRAAMSEALAGRTADEVAIAIDGVRSVVHTLHLPPGARGQLDDVLPFELDAALPVDMAESVFDYRVCATRAPGVETRTGTPRMTVLALVARAEDVRARIALVREALGRETERVEAGAFALANLVPFVPLLPDEATLVFVDVGVSGIEILISALGEPVFARAATWGAEGRSAASERRIARELRLTINAHRAAGGSAPSRVFLCGGGSVHAPVTVDFLRGELALPVEPLPPPALLQTGTSAVSVERLPAYAKALGLALGFRRHAPGLDLRRGPLAYDQSLGWLRWKVPLLAGLGAALLVSALFSGSARLYSSNRDARTLEAALALVTTEVLGKEASSAARAQALLAEQSTRTDDDPLPRVDAFDVMVKLAADVPPGTRHEIEELDVQKQHATVRGIVDSIPEGQALEPALGGERCFHGVKVASFQHQPGTDRQKYLLDLDLACPEDGARSSREPARTGPSGARED